MVVWILLLLIALMFAGWLLRWGVIFLRAGEALLYLSGGMNPFLRRLYYRIEVRTEHYPHGEDGLLPYRVYRPLARSVAPALVIYHGATPHGEEHPALDNLARALSHIDHTKAFETQSCHRPFRVPHKPHHIPSISIIPP